MLLWQGEEVDEQRAVTDSLALSDREDARASARVWQSALQSEPHFSPQPLTDTSSHIFRYFTKTDLIQVVMLVSLSKSVLTPNFV